MFRSRVSVLVGLLSLILVVVSVSAQRAVSYNTISEQEYLQLQESISSAGTVPVIVELAVPGLVDTKGELDLNGDMQAQGQAIATTQQKLLDELSGYRATPYYEYRIFPYLALHVDGPALDAILSSDHVVTVQADEASELFLASSTAVIGAPSVWARGFDGAGQTVVILDTGIDVTHPFLGDRVVAEACFSNQNNTAGGESLCPNGQGSQVGTGAANAQTDACLRGDDNLCNHGTHVAGIAAGEGTDFDGVARAADIIAIQVFTRLNGSDNCDGEPACVGSFDSDQLAAMEHIVEELLPEHQIASINMSLGGGEFEESCDGDSLLTSAINSFRSSGIATVIASGNAHFLDAISSPACVSNAISVGATEDNDDVWGECHDDICDGSNISEQLDLLAPGANIESSIPGGEFDKYYGTSMAAPHVAGTIAIMKSLSPDMTVDDIERILESTGVQVADNRDDGIHTKPRIQLDEAIVDDIDIINVTTRSPGYAGPHDNPVKVIARVTKPDTRLDADKFAVVVNGQPAQIITVFEGSDIYAIEFLPPEQDANGLYDMVVSVVTGEALVAEEQTRALNYAASNNVDTSLVIDRSGSMEEFDYMEPAKSAAALFVNLMRENDLLAVVSFNHQVQVPFAMTSLNETSRETAVTAINSITAFGTTSIGGGLGEGQRQLVTSGNQVHPWAIVLLSDGFENTAPFVDSVLPGIVASKTTVHTIALGGNADQDLLLDIAAKTGGTYNLAPSAAQLQGVYNSIAATVANQQTLLAVSGVIEAGASSIKNVVVDSTIGEATFAITWSNPDAQLQLVLGDPTGRIINPTVAATSPDMTYAEGATFAYYRIKTPTLVPGVWTIGIEGGVVPALAGVMQAAAERYEVLVSGDVVGAAATLNLYLDKSRYNVGEEIRIAATLSDDQPIIGADIVAVSGPIVLAGPPAQLMGPVADSWPIVKLYDDGNHGDGRADDGVYANTLVAAEAPGIYEFQVFTDALANNNQPFARLVRGSVNIGLTSDSFTSTESELGFSVFLSLIR